MNELEQKYREVLRLKNEQANFDKVWAAKVAAHVALSKRAGEIAEALAERIRSDPHIQQILADAFLAVHVSNDPGINPNGLHGRVMWDGVLETFFPCPDAALIDAREAAFREEHGVPLLASMAAD